ncbi:hypothetical protein EV702DRAFT_1192988 [Suillus placidus]|uniref:Uncharacterized protein n=1 Tax=Suillus placidus TaxID=48579 RepID=A0A9P7A347_9AGAM|nr:hypothetical protein EV702DRAFT_1192988 [Suillus placidus]
MYVLTVDPPSELISSCDVESSSTVPTVCPSITSLAASFDPPPLIGVGDHIAAYRHLTVDSLPCGPPLSRPAFTGKLTHIIGWSSSTIEFGVDVATVFPTPPTSIQLPASICRLSLLERLWGWLCPWPRCHPFCSPLPLSRIPSSMSDGLVWARPDD